LQQCPAIYYLIYNRSPAIDIVQGQHYAGIDQREVPRPQDGNGDGIALSDVGAYEPRIRLRRCVFLYIVI
jgi:hypothetical protein